MKENLQSKSGSNKLAEMFSLLPASYNGVPFMINTEEPIEVTFGNKIVEHQFLSDLNISEVIGKAPTKYKVLMYIAINNSFEDNELSLRKAINLMISELESPIEKLLQLPDYNALLAIPNGDILLIQYRGYATIEITFTNATTNFQQQGTQIASTASFEKSVKNDAKSFLQRSLKFKNDTFAKIQGFQGQVSLFTQKINAITEQTSSISQVILNTSLTANEITGSLSSLVSSISTMESSLTNIPNNISDFFDSLNNVFNQFKDLFLDPSTQVNAFLSIANSNDNAPTINNKSSTANDINNNGILLNICLKTLALSNIYQATPQIQFITQKNIIDLQNKTTALYNYIISNGFDFSIDNLEKMRGAFLQSTHQLYQNAILVAIENVKSPTDLHTLVYKYNGNYDFYDQTIIINNLQNTYAVQGEIQILLNDIL